MSDATAQIVDVTARGFESEVLERSKSIPVVVDFWAPWCAPCRMLGPVLEKLAGEFAGRFVLARANIDEMPEVAARFGVMSIPAVFGVRDGRVRNSFVGVIGESAIRSFLERLLPTPAETLVARASALEASDPKAAEAAYREAIALAPQDPAGKIGLARVLLAQGKTEEAQTLIAELERRGLLEPEAARIKAALELKHATADLPSLEVARAAVASNPSDLWARYRLAEALAAAGQYNEALEIALALIEQDRRGTGEAAHKLMLRIFQLLPADSELPAHYRRQLGILL